MARAKTAINDIMFPVSTNGTDVGQHSARGVSLHPVLTPIRLEKLWVAMGSIASTSAIHFADVAEGLGYGLSQDSHQSSGSKMAKKLDSTVP